MSCFLPAKAEPSAGMLRPDMVRKMELLPELQQIVRRVEVTLVFESGFQKRIWPFVCLDGAIHAIFSRSFGWHND